MSLIKEMQRDIARQERDGLYKTHLLIVISYHFATFLVSYFALFPKELSFLHQKNIEILSLVSFIIAACLLGLWKYFKINGRKIKHLVAAYSTVWMSAFLFIQLQLVNTYNSQEKICLIIWISFICFFVASLLSISGKYKSYFPTLICISGLLIFLRYGLSLSEIFPAITASSFGLAINKWIVGLRKNIIYTYEIEQQVNEEIYAVAHANHELTDLIDKINTKLGEIDLQKIEQVILEIAKSKKVGDDARNAKYLKLAHKSLRTIKAISKKLLVTISAKDLAINPFIEDKNLDDDKKQV